MDEYKHQVNFLLASEKVAKERYVLFPYYHGIYMFPVKK
jgi:hypothetical protein